MVCHLLPFAKVGQYGCAWLIEGGFKQRCDHGNTCMLFIGTRHPMLFIGPRLPITGSALVSLQLQLSIENLTMFVTSD